MKKVVFGELVKRKPNAKYTPGLSIENFEQQRRKVNNLELFFFSKSSVQKRNL